MVGIQGHGRTRLSKLSSHVGIQGYGCSVTSGLSPDWFGPASPSTFSPPRYIAPG
jgi:hypothetical protein